MIPNSESLTDQLVALKMQLKISPVNQMTWFICTHRRHKQHKHLDELSLYSCDQYLVLSSGADNAEPHLNLGRPHKSAAE